MRAPSFYSDPHVQFLSQLLDEVGAGMLQVPRFQRPLVWNWDRRRELLRSIRDGIPIGAVMVWRTATTSIECYNYLGPYKLRSPDLNSTRSYLLDGVQRLSTLYGALHKPSTGYAMDYADDYVEDGEDLIVDDADGPDDFVGSDGGFNVFVDLKNMDFCIPEYDDVTDLMPLNIVYDSVALLQYQRRLSVAGEDDLIIASDEIARAFRDYKLPIIPITTDDVDMATRTFQRINSQGAKMSEAHMVHALTWSSQFDLRREMNDIVKELLSGLGWGHLDEDPILKAIKAAFGLDVYKTNAQELSDALKSEPTVVREVVQAISRVAGFLWTDCGVPSPDFVPYALQIVVLAEAFRHKPDQSNKDRENLRAWFWVTTYGELFAGMSGDRVQLALADMRQMLSSETPCWTWKRPWEERPLARTFDFRAARTKALVFRLAERQNRVLGNLAGSKLLANSGRKAVVQVVPWVNASRSTYSSPANRFLVAPGEAPALKERILGNSLTQVDRDCHMIDDQACLALSQGDYSGFAEARLWRLEREERDFLSPLVSGFLEPRLDVVDQ
ncbi:hypothetical protein CK215_22095 [Mesorhizobium sp. WSM3864]|uniref:DUF262 domain-containing protein n=1 Tax=Mesorhizobium sp. WSM3864 TaxID=2029404 RepID=UPI000BB0917E|nr:DUF262 domain-containing protein [Mesorhizobium sp. WSM3864]PBB90347.1 hypothetical protein CK215_22095 [Mesorhizobium sp. WSM3864]